MKSLKYTVAVAALVGCTALAGCSSTTDPENLSNNLRNTVNGTDSMYDTYTGYSTDGYYYGTDGAVENTMPYYDNDIGYGDGLGYGDGIGSDTGDGTGYDSVLNGSGNGSANGYINGAPNVSGTTNGAPNGYGVMPYNSVNRSTMNSSIQMPFTQSDNTSASY